MTKYVVQKMIKCVSFEPWIEFMGSYEDCLNYVNAVVLNSMKNAINSDDKLDNFTINYEFKTKENVTISQCRIDESGNARTYFSVNYQIHLWNWKTN